LNEAGQRRQDENTGTQCLFRFPHLVRFLEHKGLGQSGGVAMPVAVQNLSLRDYCEAFQAPDDIISASSCAIESFDKRMSSSTTRDAA
jgi:hypothetical protein